MVVDTNIGEDNLEVLDKAVYLRSSIKNKNGEKGRGIKAIKFFTPKNQ